MRGFTGIFFPWRWGVGLGWSRGRLFRCFWLFGGVGGWFRIFWGRLRGLVWLVLFVIRGIGIFLPIKLYLCRNSSLYRSFPLKNIGKWAKIKENWKVFVTYSKVKDWFLYFSRSDLNCFLSKSWFSLNSWICLER